MTIKSILTLISLGLLIYLLVDSLRHIDIAVTKNDSLLNEKKADVDRLQSIDTVKLVAKQNLDIIRQNAKRNSEIATRRFWVVAILAIVQIVLLTYYRIDRSKA